jgi:hypothetical protein
MISGVELSGIDRSFTEPVKKGDKSSMGLDYASKISKLHY